MRHGRRAGATDQRGARPSRAGRPGSRVVARDGVASAYEVYGQEHHRRCSWPTWSIVHSRFWKAQVGYLARHYRVVTFDGRGSGRSGRPRGRRPTPTRSTPPTPWRCWTPPDRPGGAGRAVLRGRLGAAPGRRPPRPGARAARHRPLVRLRRAGPAARRHPTGRARSTSTEGWAKYNQHYWLDGGYDDFVEFFFGQMFSEPHSTKQIEDCVGWAHEITPQVWPTPPPAARLRRRACTADRAAVRPGAAARSCRPRHRRPDPPARLRRAARRADRRLAGAARGRRPRAAGPRPGAGQPPDRATSSTGCARRPPAAATWVAPRPRRPRRAGAVPLLAHRARATPAATSRSPPSCASGTRTCRSTGWRSTRSPRCSSAPASGCTPRRRWLANESAHIEHEAGEHDLHAFQAIRRMDEILVHNFMVFDDVVERRAVRPRRRRRGLGRRLLPAREPRAQAVRVRVDDRLRRLAADARRRRGRGGAHRRLQRAR